MATEDNRSDAQKATNVSLTPPDQDLNSPGSDYPPGGGKEIRAGSGGHHQPPGYGAPPGRHIDPDVDPAAPTAQPGNVANDLDEGAHPAPDNGAAAGAAAGAAGGGGGAFQQQPLPERHQQQSQQQMQQNGPQV